MKHLALSVSLLLVVSQVKAQAQQQISLPEVDRQLAILTAETTTSSGSKLFVTPKTFNHFAAKRQAYYLSGTTNLSLFKNFAIANITDGTLQVGHNFTPQKEDDLVSDVFTIALQSNIANNLSNLLAKERLANDLGIPLVYTHLFVGSTGAGLDSADILELSNKRAFQHALLMRKLNDELRTIRSINAGGTVGMQAAESSLVKKGSSEFYDSELALFEEQFPSFHTIWARAQAFVPVTATTYQVAPTSSLNFQEENTRKWSAGINVGGVRENTYYWGAIYFNLSARVLYTNAAEQKANSIQSYNQYNLLNLPNQQNQLYYKDDATKVYIGDLNKDWTCPLQLQLIYFFRSRGDTKTGIDVQVERYSMNYTKTNLLLGIPVFLKGREDKGVNIEAQLRWRDVDKKVLGSDRFTVSLSVALPFGSIL
jgi:hypothetical protein